MITIVKGDMMILNGMKSGPYIIPDTPKFTGGEGSIYFTADGKVVKIYKPSVLSNHPELLPKLTHMLNNPPGQILVYMAWPIDIVFSNGSFCGFVMNNLSEYKELKTLHGYNLSNPQNQRLKLHVAYNLCIMVDILHRHGYTIGDFNPKNIGYNSEGRVCFFDNDSFQFIDNKGNLYRCGVDFRGYVAPEIMDETERIAFEKFQRTGHREKVELTELKQGFTYNTDRFALAVHLFQLLMNGQMPYSSKEPRSYYSVDQYQVSNSVSSSSTSSVSDEENVRNDRYCFSPGRVPYSEFVPLERYFPSFIMDLFRKSFRHINGGENRPTAYEWKNALEQYGPLTTCRTVPQHVYWHGSSICPYCDADKRWHDVQESNKTVKSSNNTNNNATYKPSGSKTYQTYTPAPVTFPTSQSNQQRNTGGTSIASSQSTGNFNAMSRFSFLLLGTSIGVACGAFIPNTNGMSTFIALVLIIPSICYALHIEKILPMIVWTIPSSVIGYLVTSNIHFVSVNMLAVISTAIMSIGLLLWSYDSHHNPGLYPSLSLNSNKYSIMMAIVLGFGLSLILTSLVLFAETILSFIPIILMVLMGIFIIFGHSIMSAISSNSIATVISLFISFWIISMFFSSNLTATFIIGIILSIVSIIFSPVSSKAGSP